MKEARIQPVAKPEGFIKKTIVHAAVLSFAVISKLMVPAL